MRPSQSRSHLLPPLTPPQAARAVARALPLPWGEVLAVAILMLLVVLP